MISKIALITTLLALGINVFWPSVLATTIMGVAAIIAGIAMFVELVIEKRA